MKILVCYIFIILSVNKGCITNNKINKIINCQFFLSFLSSSFEYAPLAIGPECLNFGEPAKKKIARDVVNIIHEKFVLVYLSNQCSHNFSKNNFFQAIDQTTIFLKK